VDLEVFSLNRTLTIDSLAAQPWALDRSVLAELVAAAERGTYAAISRPPAEPRTQGVVAVIPIHGAIERRSSFLGELFGSASLESLRAQLRGALADPEVRGIVLSVDSPGGTAAGVQELAAEIRAARGTKPILAHVDITAASAAYWLATQADEVVVTPSGQVGSVGAYAIHEDVSAALDKAGIKITIVSAGEHKVEGNEFEPLTDEARQAIQERVDAVYEQFVADVARGRNTTSAKVKADYGKGRMLLANDALAAGMVDAIDTLDGAIRRVARLARANGIAAEATGAADEPAPFLDRISALAADTEALVHHARVRIDLRAKEGRPGLSPTAVASLRAIRDAISALPLDEPVADQPPAADPPPVAPEPPVPVVPVAASAAPATPRFRSDADWLRFLQEH
jgi:signal peptide peptidase SppA